MNVWMYGSELVSYFWPPWDRPSPGSAMRIIITERPGSYEGWNYPGLVVWLALGVCWLCWARRRPIALPPAIGRFLILSAILVLLSLSGGPGIFMYSWFPSFRCYGRAGMLALALWAVAVPVALYQISHRIQRPFLRHAFFLFMMGLALSEGGRARSWVERGFDVAPPPPWVAWLARQPSGVSLAAFQPLKNELPGDFVTGYWEDLPLPKYRSAGYGWTWESPYYALLHNHLALNGADIDAVDADLRMLGASIERDEMNEAGLRFLASRGYNHFAFRRDYLTANPKLPALPWLEPAEVIDDWMFYRVRNATKPSVAASNATSRRRD